MNNDLLKIINDVVVPDEPITENTVISECEDIDSLALLNLFIEFRKIKNDLVITDFSKCRTIQDVINLVQE